MSLDPSEWRKVYHDRYEVSIAGHVRNVATLKILKPGRQSSGYYTVCLYDGSKPKRPRSHLVHRLVLAAFKGVHPDATIQTNHKDGNKANNALTNLEYATGKENIRHAIDVLGHHVGERNHRCKLTAAQVAEIITSPLRNFELAKVYGITPSHISAIRRGIYRKAR